MGLRRQGVRKTPKPEGDAQHPWPAACIQIIEQKLRQFNFENNLGGGGPSLVGWASPSDLVTR